ncbi:MAG: DUF4350 domain-containing protein [Nitriliruptorales bacterium]|nr:DUF4350 domain-containing protein [Nitriliruptorales bacterium]
MRSRRLVIAAAILTILGVFALYVAGRGGTLDGPDGTAAFERLVASFGGEVRQAEGPIDGSTLVLLRDLRTPEEADEILEWVRSGGRLVLGQPDSEIAARIGIAPSQFVSGSVLGTASLEPVCAAPEVVGVDEVEVRAVDLTVATGAQPDVLHCLARGGGDPYMVVVPVGAGTVVVLGGPTALWNERLDRADNALFALRLVGGPGSNVVMGAAVPASRPTPGLVESLPGSVRMGVLGLILAGITFAAVRWRRLGMPPEETASSPLPASALVEATGHLLRSSEDRTYVAKQLRDHHAGLARRRLGLPPELTPREVGRAMDVRFGGSGETEELFARGAPQDDEQLLRYARDLHRSTRRIEEAT